MTCRQVYKLRYLGTWVPGYMAHARSISKHRQSINRRPDGDPHSGSITGVVAPSHQFGTVCL